MKKFKTRELCDTSWLAQIIQDKMDVEFTKNGTSTKWLCLQVLHLIVNEADNPANDSIYYDNYNGKREIIIRDIPSFAIEQGLNFSKEGMQSKLRGLSEKYKYDDGQYIVSVLTTHDLNSAEIKDLSELMFQISAGYN